MAITLASEGEETNKLKAIVAKTGSVIRVMFALSACLAINPFTTGDAGGDPAGHEERDG